MARSSLSKASKTRLRKSFAAVAVLIVTPLVVTYWNVHQWLALENCVLYRESNFTIGTKDASYTNGLICKSGMNRPYFVDISSFAQSPPSIARLVTTITKESTLAFSVSHFPGMNENLRKPLQKLDLLKQEGQQYNGGGFYSYDYAEKSLTLLGIFQETIEKSDTNHLEEVDASFGFRKNPNKNSSTSAVGSVGSSPRIPVATYFWLLLNVGLYGWYFYKKIDSRKVSLNGKFLRDCGDFGRAFSGNLAHFEIWHLGLNAMSLVSLGENLELDHGTLGGSIGLFLWTGSFLVLVAAWVVLLHAIDRRFGARLWRRWSGASASQPSGFPSMVGFSGILFVWSVVRTLSLSEFQQTCPIPLLSSLCFSTHRLAGGFRFSWGPIVQLVVIQALLHKRVSFVGHLAGTIVGFLWHWGILPPLEFSQPCILYPILWIAGKCTLHHWSSSFEALAGCNEESETGSSFASTRKSSLGGGQVLGSGGSRWTLSNASPEESVEDESKSGKNRLLLGLQKFAILHACAIILVYRTNHGFALLNSVVLSELLLLFVYSLFVKAVSAGGIITNSNRNEKVHPLACLGVLGRAYVAFAVVLVVTDSMAMGGWWAALRLSEIESLVLVLVTIRIPLWIISAAVVCHALESANELQLHVSSNGASDVGGANGGIWTHVFGWTVAEPCMHFGKILAKAKWDNSSQSTSTVVSNHMKQSLTPGRSTSNVAGKSRLVDRGTTNSRGMV